MTLFLSSCFTRGGQGTTNNIDLEYGIWILEASINFHNRGNEVGGDPLYVNFNDRVEMSEINLPFTTSSGDMFTSEAALFDFYEDMLEVADGKAPFSDLEMVETSGGDIRVSGTFFASMTSNSSCIQNIPSGIHRPAAWPYQLLPACGPCVGGSCASASENSTVVINKALSYGIHKDGLCGWEYYGWNYTITDYYVKFFGPPSSTVKHPFNFKLVTHPNVAQLPNIVGSGSTHEYKLFGARSVHVGDTPAGAEQCLSSTNMQTWKTNAEAILSAEQSYLNGSLFLMELVPKAFINSPTNVEGHHELVLTTGISGVMPD